MFVILLLAGLAQADTWTLDSTHSKVGFRVSHMMVSSVEGRFGGVTGTLDFEPGKVGDLDIEVEVDMATIDTANAKRDGHLQAAGFLDVANHPSMRFESRKVKVTRGGEFDLSGDLTLRGVTKPITLHGSGLALAVTDPWGNERVGAHATAIINRQDFGVTWNQALEAGGVLVGDEVHLRIDVEFTKDK
jgi:polyisoprenoid-binding protein YceI